MTFFFYWTWPSTLVCCIVVSVSASVFRYFLLTLDCSFFHSRSSMFEQYVNEFYLEIEDDCHIVFLCYWCGVDRIAINKFSRIRLFPIAYKYTKWNVETTRMIEMEENEHKQFKREREEAENSYHRGAMDVLIHIDCQSIVYVTVHIWTLNTALVDTWSLINTYIISGKKTQNTLVMNFIYVITWFQCIFCKFPFTLTCTFHQQ